MVTFIGMLTRRWLWCAQLALAAVLGGCLGSGTQDTPPVFTSLPSINVLSGESVTFTVQARDPEGSPVRLSATDLPPFAQFYENGGGTATLKLRSTEAQADSFHDNGGGSATIELQPTEAQVGLYQLRVTATEVDDHPLATQISLPVRVRSKALVQSCAPSDDAIRAQAQALSTCRAANGDVDLGSGATCKSAWVDRDFIGPQALGRVNIHAGGALYFLDETRTVEVASIQVAGRLQAGTASCPIGTDDPENTVTVRFTGEGPTTPPPAPPMDVTCNAVDKGIGVQSGGELEMNGARGLADTGVSWTHLSRPAGPAAYQAVDQGIAAPVAAGGEKTLLLARDVSKGSNPWQSGDWITVATSSFSPFETEFVQIASVAPSGSGSIVTLRQALRHYHFGGDDPGVPGDANFNADARTNYGVDERAEVGLISRSIKLTAQTPDSATAPQDTRLHWGGEIKLCKGLAAAKLRGVEIEKFGKEQLGSYPIHFHMAGDVANQPVISSNSIHHSYNKCVTAHATQNLAFTDNVCARAVGHLFYEELGSEQNIAFVGNLGLGAMSHHFGIADSVAKTDDGLPRNFWEGDHLASANGYSAFNVKNTDAQNNPTHSSCFTDPKTDGRLNLRGAPPCAANEYYVEPASGFWIVNPGTRLEGNSIGGCQGIGKGYWYVPPQDGAPNALKFVSSGVFTNNRVHACYDGLFTEPHFGTYSEQLFPTKDGLGTSDPASVNVIGRFSGLTATRIRNRGAWMRPMWNVLENGRFATNRDSVTLVSSGGLDGNGPGVWALLKNSVVVGLSNVARWGPCPSESLGDGPGCVDLNPNAKEVMEKGYQTPRWNSAGYMIYDGPVRIIDDRFVNFLRDINPLLTVADRKYLAAFKGYGKPDVPYEGDAALGWFQNNQSAYPTASVVKGLSFDNVDLRHQIYTAEVNLGDFRDGDLNTAVIDLDGSLTGYKVVNSAGQPVPDAYPISLNNLPINASSNAVDECLAEGQQDTQLEGRATSLISPGSMATLEFEAQWPVVSGSTENWQDVTFFKDSPDYGQHQSMTLRSRNGLGVWEPKVTSGLGYSVLTAALSTVPGVKTDTPGIPALVRLGLTDAVKPHMDSEPFYVRVGICYTDASGAAPAGNFTIRRGYKSWGGNGVSYNNPLVQSAFNKLELLYNGETCHNLDHQVTGNIGAKGCPAHGVIPVPASGTCPLPSVKDGSVCAYPVTPLTAAAAIGDLTKTDGTPALDKYYYDKDIGMLYLNVVQDAPNAKAVAPVGSCPGDPACPGEGELETYFGCPPQGCINYSVQLNDAYTPGVPKCNEKAGGSVYSYQSGRYALPEPPNQNRLAYAVPASASAPGIADGEIVQREEIPTNSKGFAHSVATKAPFCAVTTLK